MRGSVILASAVLIIWTLVYVITQLMVTPALPVLPTAGIGVALTLAVVLGYPSALRGPRGSRGVRGAHTAGRAAAARRDLPEHGVGELAVRAIPLRSGLTQEAARRTCALLRPMLAGDAVSITDTENILAYIGPGEDHHVSGGAMQTSAAPRAVRKGKTVVVRDKKGVGCRDPDCEVLSAVIAPLRIGQRVVGTLGVYQATTVIPPQQMVEDMAKMLSLHLELAELDREKQLAASARLDALRAQINPHFLFNILNTIASKARTRPDEARELLLRLSEFFRYAVRQEGHMAEFAQEYFFVRTYISLEQARFGDRLQVRYDIDPQVLTSRVPVLTIQPLVENAVKHGIGSKPEGGTVRLRARVDPLTRTTSIRVSDDGVGMDPEVLAKLTAGEGDVGDHAEAVLTNPSSTTEGHAGVGLRNISERLDSLFGDRYDMSISTPKSGGTVIELQIPLR
ncbi:histidine kinase [Nesterenkonia natronophila]|uniref:GAF domain-containing protein n=1 Tax=Nesterenkonia natronophila TaxID=2174932 RepID=A0A3A4F461_9MICC|nr:histidine kinase [Nesterenkonia natronophila]RJN32648.1 GAF domain-containing protein [Nesterenkonia natronophila]